MLIKLSLIPPLKKGILYEKCVESEYSLEQFLNLLKQFYGY